jgi:hypothetical protein
MPSWHRSRSTAPGTAALYGLAGGAGEAGFVGVRDAGGWTRWTGWTEGTGWTRSTLGTGGGLAGLASLLLQSLPHAANAAGGRWLASASCGARRDAGIDHAAQPRMLDGGTDREEPPAASAIANTPADALGTPSPSLRSGPPQRGGRGWETRRSRSVACTDRGANHEPPRAAPPHPSRAATAPAAAAAGGAPDTLSVQGGDAPLTGRPPTSGRHPTRPSGSPDRRHR